MKIEGKRANKKIREFGRTKQNRIEEKRTSPISRFGISQKKHKFFSVHKMNVLLRKYLRESILSFPVSFP